MWGKSEIVVSALLLSLSVGSPALAKKPKPTPCPPDRYLLPSGISSLTGGTSGESVPLVLGSGQSSLGSCTLRSGKAKANKKGITTIVAKSPPGTTCNGFKKVVVRVSIPSGCQSATIKVKAKKFPLQTLQANRSFCGDGQIDAAAGEQCDGSGCPATASCDGSCTCQPNPTTTTTSTTAPASTIATTSTTSSTTTTTTIIGKCLDVDGNLTAQACSFNTDCPVNPDGHSGPFACCGNGVSDFGETCDKGTDNCPAGNLCPSDCTADCKSIGRCTMGAGGLTATACLAVGDCPAGQACCGDRTIDSPETCDDGNFVSGDSCPDTCFIASCTAVPASTVTAHVTYTHPAGTTISGLVVFVDYPEAKVTAPTKGATQPFGVSPDINDLSYAFSANAVKLGGLPSPFVNVVFETCNGAPAVTAGEFTCTVTDASDDQGNVVDKTTLGCAVTLQ
jgi:cysteine-rich repeat protein